MKIKLFQGILVAMCIVGTFAAKADEKPNTSASQPPIVKKNEIGAIAPGVGV